MHIGSSPGRAPRYLFRGDPGGRRSRPIYGALGLRAARGDHTRAEAGVVAAATAEATNVVEIGAFEGGGSVVIRASMAPGGTLTVVDPYPRGRFGFSAPLVTARRLAHRQPQVTTRWLRVASLDAAGLWESELDAVVIDGIHTLEAVREDWSAWGPFVRSGGALVARNDVIAGTNASEEERSSSLLAASGAADLWDVVQFADSLTAFRRR
jgi:predicted O-methyltransferase YrrM